MTEDSEAPEEAGELMRRVAAGLILDGFDITLPLDPAERRLLIVCPGAQCSLRVEDTGYIVWEWQAAAAGQTDPRHLVRLARTLLSGRTEDYSLLTADVPGLKLKGLVARELVAEGYGAALAIYRDKEFYDAAVGVVLTAPGDTAELRVSDDGRLTWERDYWLDEIASAPAPEAAADASEAAVEAAAGPGESGSKRPHARPEEMAPGIVAEISRVMTVAAPRYRSRK